MLVFITLCSMLLASCSEVEDTKISFISSDIPEGSTISTNSIITLTFDGIPEDLTTNANVTKISGNTVKVSGPFEPGELNLQLNWGKEKRIIFFTVEPPPSEIVTNNGGKTDMVMVLVPAGEFKMGSVAPGTDVDEQPVHTVYVDAFYIDKYNVTNAQYRDFLIANPQWQKGRIPIRFHDGDYLDDWNGNEYPTGHENSGVKVNWYAAMTYSRWVGKRLLTEAEWEKAARGGLEGKKYLWGDELLRIDPEEQEWVGHDQFVMSISNGYGVYYWYHRDPQGFVRNSEWCLDKYIGGFYKGNENKNPIAGEFSIKELRSKFPQIPKHSSRSVRPGSYDGGETVVGIGVSGRKWAYPTDSIYVRCVKSLFD